MSELNNQFGNHPEPVTEAEVTLRLIAQQPAPEGLAERVHRRMEQHLAQQRLMLASQTERKGFWHLWLPAHRMQFAGAAALAVVIAVSTLSVRHPNPHAKTPQAPAPVPVQSGGFGSSFGTSAAQAYPTTLKPIPVPAQKKRKPSAGHAAKRPVQNPVASEANATSTAPR